MIKVQQGNEDDLTIAEAKKIEPWKKVDPEELSAAQELEGSYSLHQGPSGESNSHSKAAEMV